MGSVSRPGGAQPLRCLETARHLRLQHRTDPLRLDLHKTLPPRRERTVRKQGPAAGWEQNTGDKGTIKWDAVSLSVSYSTSLRYMPGNSCDDRQPLLWLTPGGDKEPPKNH